MTDAGASGVSDLARLVIGPGGHIASAASAFHAIRHSRGLPRGATSGLGRKRRGVRRRSVQRAGLAVLKRWPHPAPGPRQPDIAANGGRLSGGRIAGVRLRTSWSPVRRAEAPDMDSPARSKRLRLRRAGRCLVCEHAFAVGDEAVWHRDIRQVTCVGCHLDGRVVVEGKAGASALREHERRRQRRENHAREKLGAFGVLLARVIDEPTSTKVWRQGAHGEVRSAGRLAKHLDGTEVRLLHDRRIPGHGQANIDHLTVGPGGVTVIDSKTHSGKIRVDHVGGLFAPRRAVLLINGRDQTRLIDGVERQVAYVRAALSDLGEPDVELRGAMCFPNVDGLPLFRQLSPRDIIIDGPKPVSKLAARAGSLRAEDIDRVWRALAHRFPPA